MSPTLTSRAIHSVLPVLLLQLLMQVCVIGRIPALHCTVFGTHQCSYTCIVTERHPVAYIFAQFLYMCW